MPAGCDVVVSRSLRTLVVAGVIGGVFTGCGSASSTTTSQGVTATQSASPATSAVPTPTPTPAPAPTPTPTATPAALRIEVPSLSIVAALTPVSCDSFPSAAPMGATVDFADCTNGDQGFAGFIGAGGGPLQPLTTAPSGTQVIWYSPPATRHTATITGDPVTAQQSPDGTWPGHGVGPRSAFFEVRAGSRQTERQSSDRT